MFPFSFYHQPLDRSDHLPYVVAPVQQLTIERRNEGMLHLQTFWEGGPNPKFPNFDVSILHRDRRSKEENHVRWRDIMPSGHRQGSEGIGEPHGAGEGQR